MTKSGDFDISNPFIYSVKRNFAKVQIDLVDWNHDQKLWGMFPFDRYFSNGAI
jgi:hypothetical protein